MKSITKILFINILFFISLTKCLAQTDTEFWFCVPQLTTQHEYDEPTLFITSASDETAHVRIEMPLEPRFTAVDLVIPPGEQRPYNLKDYFTGSYSHEGVYNPNKPNDKGNFIESGLGTGTKTVKNKAGQDSTFVLYESCRPTNKGFRITSDQPVTAYLQRGNTNNCDIWAFKGKNALGTYFIVPSEEIGNCNEVHSASMKASSATNPGAWNAIDIVAVENCVVTVTLREPGLVNNWPSNNGKTARFTLKRGQTLNLQAASQVTFSNNNKEPYKSFKDKNLTGTIINSTGKIVVQWKDDSLLARWVNEAKGGKGTSWDAAGDQLVPVELAGTEYIVMRGQLANDLGGNRMYENVYFMSTVSGPTIVEFKPVGGETIANDTLYGVGDWSKLLLNSKNMEVAPNVNFDAVQIKADKPIIVWHISGSSGAEVGGAILPRTSGCTGSTDVTVCRSNTSSFDFWLNIMCKKAHKGDFIVTVNGDNTKKYSFDPDLCFTDIPGTDWCYLNRDHMKFSGSNGDYYKVVKDKDGNDSITTQKVSRPAVGLGKTIKVSNTTGIFHLAVINGNNDGSCQYGYFSDFRGASGSAAFTGDDPDEEIPYLPFCFGDTVQLQANGGISYFWEYATEGFAVDKTFVGNNAAAVTKERKKEKPKVVPAKIGANDYKVTIKRRCYTVTPDTTIVIEALGIPSVAPDFDIDVSPCSPAKIVVTNTTNTGDFAYDYLWTLDDGKNVSKSTNKNYGRDTLTLYNTSDSKTTYHLSLETSIASNCPQSKSAVFETCPGVIAKVTPEDTISCQPFEVEFFNLSEGDYNEMYIDYGDGKSRTEWHRSVTTPNPPEKFKHTYTNNSTRDTVYLVKVWVRDTVFGCVDTTIVRVGVFGKVKAQYTIDKSTSCSPLEVKFTNISIGDQQKVTYKWDVGLPSADSTVLGNTNDLVGVPFKLTYLNPSSNSNPKKYPVWLTATRKNGYNNTECIDRSPVDTLTVYPEFKVNYITDTLTGCNPVTIKLTNKSTDLSASTQFSWDLGDGTSENSNGTFEHVYAHTKPNTQTFSTKLSGESKYGCQSSMENAVISVPPYLNPNFTIDRAQGCSPLEVTIRNNTPQHASKDYSGWKVMCDDSVTWTQVNGALGVDSTVVLRFVNKTGLRQIVTISLTDSCFNVENGTYCRETFTQEIEIFPEIDAVIASDKTAPVCDSTAIAFTNTSRITGISTAPSDYMWDFGDGSSMKSTSTDAVSHIFRNLSDSTGTTPQEFVVTMVATAYGCTDTASTTVKVYPKVMAVFSSDNYKYCTPGEATIVNSSVGANRYKFSFSDGTADTVVTAGLVYKFTNRDPEQIAVKRVTLTAMNGECRDSISKNYYAYPVVVPRLTVSPDAGCGPIDVTVDRTTTTGASTYKIDFGDGVTDETGNGSITHSFGNKSDSDTTYTIRLTATNVLGCSADTTATVTVYPEIKAAFSYEKTTDCSPMDVKMINNSLNGSKFTWSFGDGTDSEEKTTKDDFTHLYTNSSVDGNSISTYNIKLVVVDANHTACRDSATKQIQVYPKVIAAFKTENDEGCSPLTTTFTNQSKGYKLTYIWDYDHDNKQSGESAVTHSHTFDNIEASTHTYNIKLTVTDINGCSVDTTLPVKAYPHVTADFTYVKNDACTPYPVTFSYPAAALNGNKFAWDFGFDSNKAVKTNKNSFDFVFDNSAANTVKTYDINLISTDTLTGCADTITKPIEVYPRLVPAFTQDTYEGCNPLPVKFTNKTTGLADYLWDFGDSQSSAETSPTHLFKHFELTDKTYNVVLKTTQTATGCVKSIDTTVTVYSYVLAKFGINETNEGANGITEILGGCTPFDVTITDSSRLTNKGTWSWDFGNDSTSNIRQPGSLVYTNNDNTYPLENKNYTIKLVVTNDHGCKHDTAQTITVYPRSVPDFGGNLAGCEPLTITFTDKSVVDSKTQYYWTFSDGSTIVDKPPFSKTFHNYDYTDSKKYTVNLKTTTEYNCTDEITKEIEVYAKPLAKFIPLMDRACPPFEAEFKNASIGNEPTYYWDFGNGSRTTTTDIANQKNEYQNYTDEPITIDVQLITESGYGCRDTMTNPMITFPNIAVDFEFDSAGCSPHTVEIKNLSTKTVDNHLWYFGEGSTSVAKEPTFTYFNTTDNDQTLTITYIGLSKYQCTDTIKKNVTVYISPNVDFVAHAPSQRYPDDTVYFENYTQDGPWYYEWEFGDGHTLKTDEKYFMYKYGKWAPNEDNNIFNVSLNVQTEHCRNKVTHEVEILPPHPKIEILNNSPSGCVPLTVQFKINDEYCNTYEWNFEDGTSSTEPEPVHEFTEPGIYNVKLTVEGDGGSHYDYEIITVNELPEPDFTTTPKYVMLPDQPVQFFNSTRNGYTYIWDFGDGNYSTEINPYHQYTQEGFYDVKLIAISQAMCTDSIIKEQEVEVSGAGYIKFPNAFLPSEESPLDGTYPVPDDVDNVFHPVWHGVKKFEMWIFNRWGEQLFYSDDVNVGWNGKYGNNGTELGQDVYFWKAKGKFENNVPFKLAGDVTLIRR